MSIIEANNLIKDYGTKKTPIQALGPVSFEIPNGSFSLILGKSGSGKSTLLNLLAGLDKASSGSLTVEGKNLAKLSQNKLSNYRGKIGIVFQFYNLLPNLNTMENILMGSWATGTRANKIRAYELLEKFNLTHRKNSNVKTLSGGEKQRVAICRALINNPKILFCDEPTGALDSQNEKLVINILRELSMTGLTVVMVTHSQEFRNLANQIISLQDGKIASIEYPKV